MRYLAMLLLVALVSSCGGQKESVTNRLVTAKQEMADLERAHKLGIISDTEYKQELSKISSQE